MNEVMNAILTRRSIRKFTADPIPAEVLEDLVKAALHAPSGMGKQTWQFTVVTNHEIIHRLCGLIGTELGREGYDMYGPAAVIIPSNEKESPWGKEDNACAMENIFLAAHSLGIGSVWINQAKGICDEPEVRQVLREFGMPDTHVIWGMAALGYPAETPAEKPRAAGPWPFHEMPQAFGAAAKRPPPQRSLSSILIDDKESKFRSMRKEARP